MESRIRSPKENIDADLNKNLDQAFNELQREFIELKKECEHEFIIYILQLAYGHESRWDFFGKSTPLEEKIAALNDYLDCKTAENKRDSAIGQLVIKLDRMPEEKFREAYRKLRVIQLISLKTMFEKRFNPQISIAENINGLRIAAANQLTAILQAAFKRNIWIEETYQKAYFFGVGSRFERLLLKLFEKIKKFDPSIQYRKRKTIQFPKTNTPESGEKEKHKEDRGDDSDSDTSKERVCRNGMH